MARVVRTAATHANGTSSSEVPTARRPQGRKETQGVPLELTAAQREEVLRAAEGGGAVSALLWRGEGAGERFAAAARAWDSRRLSRSLVAGLMMLASIPSDERDISVSELARLLGMSTNTAYRYCSTLLTLGLVERDPMTRRYRLAAGTATQGAGGRGQT